MRALSEVLIKGGRVDRRDRRARRRRAACATGRSLTSAADLQSTGDVLDASGCVVTPGFVDLHVHLREPGDEEAETIETGTRAAARGGFTAVVAMPNTRPALDDAAVVSSVLALGKQAGLCDVVSSGCITVARAGEQLAPMGELYALGVRIFTDDGFCVAERGRDAPRARVRGVAAGCDRRPARRGRDPRRRRPHARRARGRAGSASPVGPSVAETVIVARDIELCEVTGTPVHFLHCSAAGTVALVRAAKARGLPVTAGVRAAPLLAHRRVLRGLRPDVQGAPAAAHRRPTSRRSARAWPTAPSTPSPPTTRPTRPSRRSGRSRRRPRACSDSRPRSRSPSPSWSSPGTCRSAGCPGAACRGDPRPSPGLDAHGGPIAPGAPRQPRRSSTPATSGSSNPSGLASRARNTPFAGRTLRGQGAGTRCSSAMWSCATARRPDERRDAILVLADGTEFEGEAIGALPGRATRSPGELVFNTALSGYQEIVTDPSYAGQVITFTYPHIGNYGVNADDDESRRPFCAGRGRARPRRRTTATGAPPASLDDLLVRHGVPGISGIDTRRLTRHLRDEGALPGAFGTDEAAVRAAVEGARSTDGIDLVATVTTDRAVRRRQRRRALPGRRLRLRHQAHHPAAPGRRPAAASRSFRRRRPRPMSSRASRTACSSPTARVIPPR